MEPPAKKHKQIVRSLHKAVLCGKLQHVYAAIRTGANKEERAELDERPDLTSTGMEKAKGVTPLWVAAVLGNNRIVRLLVKYGADLEAKDLDHGRTALWQAAALGRVNMVKTLVQNGALINATDYTHGRSVLLAAIFHKRVKIVQLLLEHGADVGH